MSAGGKRPRPALRVVPVSGGPGPEVPPSTRDMRVTQLTVDPFTNMPVVILKDAITDETLPIGVGLHEASAIAAEIEKIALDRPVAHDLLRQLIGMVGYAVDRVEIDDERDGTLYATIHLEGPDSTPSNVRRLSLDARPSDAIALALRSDARICVRDTVLAKTRAATPGEALGPPDALSSSPSSKVVVPPPVPPRQVAMANDELVGLGEDGLRALLESLTDEEFGKWKM